MSNIQKLNKNNKQELLLWLNSLCEPNDSVFCKPKKGLIFLSENLPRNYPLNNFIKDIKIIYKELKPYGNNNMVIFRGLIENIINLDTPINTIKIISEYVKRAGNSEDIKSKLRKFKEGDWSPTSLDDFIKRTKHQTYNEYENSFNGDNFEPHRTRLILNFKKEEGINNVETIKKILKEDKNNTPKIAKDLYKNIIDNFVGDLVKSDLKCVKNILDTEGNIVIEKGDLVEVKKIDYEADSYLSEFFSVYKSSVDKLPSYAKKRGFKDNYNDLIDSVYNLLLKNDGGIINSVKDSFVGIIYDENIFIKKENLELYWSNKGRSSCESDHRLSIRYRVVKKGNKPIYGYVYKEGEPLQKVKLNIPNINKQKVYCKCN